MDQIGKAVEILKAGDVVAIPTETVYGLAGSIRSEKGLKKIFSVKERPFFDPLIVHVSSVDSAKDLAKSWPRICDALAACFWPGPLTMVVEKNEKVSDLITAGLQSVGLRLPSHPVAKSLIERLGHPLAAPSANKFKRTSPTKKSHVEVEFGKEVFVLEGGDSEVGIESTVAGVFEDRVEIYRPGMITASMIQDALIKANIQAKVEMVPSPVAPGQLKHHYMPKVPVIISWDNELPDLGSTPAHGKTLALWNLKKEAPTQVARELYTFFRDAESSGKEAIVLILDSSMKKDDAWAGVLNRLDKAKTSEV